MLCMEGLYRHPWFIRNFRFLVIIVLAADMCTLCYIAVYRPRVLRVMMKVPQDTNKLKQKDRQDKLLTLLSLDTRKSHQDLDNQSQFTAGSRDPQIISSYNRERKNNQKYINPINHKYNHISATVTSANSLLTATFNKKIQHKPLEHVTSEKTQTRFGEAQRTLAGDLASSGLSAPPSAAPINTARHTAVLITTGSQPQMSKKWANVLAAFHPTVNASEMDLMKEIVQTFVRAVDNANLTYFMYSGTLIGSYRHHGLIPWDDDIDVMMDFSQRDKIQKILSSITTIKSRYFLDCSHHPWRWKFYSEHSSTIKEVEWRWPSIDISFYKTYFDGVIKIKDADPEFSRRFNFKHSKVFPLIKRPFWNFSLKSPRDVLSILVRSYSPNICLSNTYNHHQERRIIYEPVKLSCHKLWSFYPFVFRKQVGNYVNETLRIGSKIISWKMLQNHS